MWYRSPFSQLVRTPIELSGDLKHYLRTLWEEHHGYTAFIMLAATWVMDRGTEMDGFTLHASHPNIHTNGPQHESVIIQLQIQVQWEEPSWLVDDPLYLLSHSSPGSAGLLPASFPFETSYLNISVDKSHFAHSYYNIYFHIFCVHIYFSHLYLNPLNISCCCGSDCNSTSFHLRIKRVYDSKFYFVWKSAITIHKKQSHIQV